MSDKTNEKGRYIRGERKAGYKINQEGYIVSKVIFYGETPENVINDEIPINIKNPRWNFELNEWVDGDEYKLEKDPIDALAEELLDFKIQYNSVPCQNHKDYPALVDEILKGDDKS